MTARKKELGLDREDREAFDFAKEIRARKLNQVQAAQLLHVTQATVSRWVRKKMHMPRIYREFWRVYWHDWEATRNNRGKRKPAKEAAQ